MKVRVGGNSKDDLGDCIHPPVRRLLLLWGALFIASSSQLPLQVARFEPYQMNSQIGLYAPKTSTEAAVSASLAVVAFDVLGPGGIGNAWLAGGLDTSITTGCTSNAPGNCAGSPCSTVWLQPESLGCSILNASHIHVAVVSLSPSLAVLNVTGATRGLCEREYRFQLHVPAFNGSAWRWVSIRGTFDVRAVADAALSTIRLLLAASDDTVFGVVNHQDDIEVEVEAFDVDGNRVTRAGEQISIVIRDSAGNNRTVPLQFNGTKRTYVAAFPPLSREAGRLGRPGVNDVYLSTLTSAGLVWRMQYIVACAEGSAYDDSRSECLQVESNRYVILGGAVGVIVFAALCFLMYTMYKHKDRAKAMLVSFLEQEFLLSVELAWELWDIAGWGVCVRPSSFAWACASVPTRMRGRVRARLCACVCVCACVCAVVCCVCVRARAPAYAYASMHDGAGDVFSFISMKDSGQFDLFLAFATFLIPSVIASLLIMGRKIRMIVRRVGERNAKLAVAQAHRSGRPKPDFRWLADRFILHRDQHRHQELNGANMIALHKSYAYVLLAAIQDAPFCVLNTLLLSRAFRDRLDQSFLDKQRLCSPQYGTNITMILLILLTSVASLVYKLMHLVELPRLWAAQKLLAEEEAQLTERKQTLESISIGWLAQAPAAFDPATTTEQQVALSGTEPADDDDSVGELAVPVDAALHAGGVDAGTARFSNLPVGHRDVCRD